MSTNLPQAPGSNSAWLAQGIASAAVYSAINLIIVRLYHGWVNYRTLTADAPNLNAELEKVVLVLSDMKYILSDEGFKNALNEDELNHVENLLVTLEQK